jgi:hypothetical protein
MADTDSQVVIVSKGDIATFADKLNGWGATLPPKEQALARLILERARGLEPEDVRREQVRVGLIEAVRTVYNAVAEVWQDDPTGWVRIDPVWYKAGTVEGGDEMSFTVKLGPATAP